MQTSVNEEENASLTLSMRLAFTKERFPGEAAVDLHRRASEPQGAPGADWPLPLQGRGVVPSRHMLSGSRIFRHLQKEDLEECAECLYVREFTGDKSLQCGDFLQTGACVGVTFLIMRS